MFAEAAAFVKLLAFSIVFIQGRRGLFQIHDISLISDSN